MSQAKHNEHKGDFYEFIEHCSADPTRQVTHTLGSPLDGFEWHFVPVDDTSDHIEVECALRQRDAFDDDPVDPDEERPHIPAHRVLLKLKDGHFNAGSDSVSLHVSEDSIREGKPLKVRFCAPAGSKWEVDVKHMLSI